MFSLFRKRVSPQFVATRLHGLLGSACAGDESAFESLTFRGQLTRQKFQGECAYLRCYGVEFACRRSLRDAQHANLVLSAFYAVMSEDHGFVDPSVSVEEEATDRGYVYFKAMLVDQGDDALLQLGRAFAGLFEGQSGNLHLALLGVSMFSNVVKYSEQELRRYRLAV